MNAKSFRYRFYPTLIQEQLLQKTFGCVRLVYNKALAERSEVWTKYAKNITYAEMDRHLTLWKRQTELAFLNEVSSVPLQQTLRHLQIALSKFWRKTAKYPRFKKKHSGGTAVFTRSAFKISNNQVILAKMNAPLNICWSQPLPQDIYPTLVVITLNAAGQWHISICYKNYNIKQLKKISKLIGLDLGLSSFITTSNGEKTISLKLDSDYKKLRQVSKQLNRKKKNSKNREKARLKVARIYNRITNKRHDYFHNLTTRLVRENQTICVESLNIQGMIKDKRFSKPISDASWGKFIQQLKYKCDWYGRNLIKVDRFFPSSKTCSSCGFIIESLPLRIRNWTCPKCNEYHDRDHNAAKNILAAGLAVTACGANIRPKAPSATGSGGETGKSNSNIRNSYLNMRKANTPVCQ